MRRFFSADAAMTAARSMMAEAPGVVVFKVVGTPDYWGDPILIARYGDVPAEAA